MMCLNVRQLPGKSERWQVDAEGIHTLRVCVTGLPEWAADVFIQTYELTHPPIADETVIVRIIRMPGAY